MFLAIIYGVLLAAAGAYCIVSLYINKSVVSGDSKGNFKDFNRLPMYYEARKDKVKKDYPL